MNLFFYPKKIGICNLIVLGLVGAVICLMSLNISNATSNGVTQKIQDNGLSSGIINDTLKNKKDNSIWLLSGSWKSNLFTNAKFNHTNPPKFSAQINMVMGNGSFSHKHKISHFMLTDVSTEGLSKVYEGYSSVSMELGPVFAIPVKIKYFQNGTISILLESLNDITLDQAKVISHFGGKAIFGVSQNKID